MRARPRRDVMLCLAVSAVMVAAATLAAQSHESRIDAATRIAASMLEPWLGPVPPATQTLDVTSPWPASRLTMEVEGEVAFEMARRYWHHQPPTLLMDGAARYLQGRIVSRMFDFASGRAGNGIETVPVFGGLYVHPLPSLRFDGPAAGLGRDDMSSPLSRAALAFASLERSVGSPRLIGALRSVIEAKPASDAHVIRLLQDALGQEIAWLFDAALNPARAMNYRIAGVATESCSPAPCHRVRIEVAHDGEGEFRDLEVRVDFADGQSVSQVWNGADRSRVLVFEGPSAPVRARVDPDLANLLDDNLLDQSREMGSRSNAPIGKWIARWSVWLQDAMLTYSALV